MGGPITDRHYQNENYLSLLRCQEIFRYLTEVMFVICDKLTSKDMTIF